MKVSIKLVFIVTGAPLPIEWFFLYLRDPNNVTKTKKYTESGRPRAVALSLSDTTASKFPVTASTILCCFSIGFPLNARKMQHPPRPHSQTLYGCTAKQHVGFLLLVLYFACTISGNISVNS